MQTLPGLWGCIHGSRVDIDNGVSLGAQDAWENPGDKAPSLPGSVEETPEARTPAPVRAETPLEEITPSSEPAEPLEMPRPGSAGFEKGRQAPESEGGSEGELPKGAADEVPARP